MNRQTELKYGISSNSNVRLVLMSDTHGNHREVEVPEGDLLIHAGDFTLFDGSTSAIRDFNEWLGKLPHGNKIVVPGNHDSGFVDPAYRELITEATLLVNEGTSVGGLKIWGSPVTPNDWGAFGSETDEERECLYAQIPLDLDIQVTHGPPRGILDGASCQNKIQDCDQLLAAVKRVKPRLHVFGHIHQQYGMLNSASTVFVNASVADSDYTIKKRPVEIVMRSKCTPRGCRAGLYFEKF